MKTHMQTTLGALKPNAFVLGITSFILQVLGTAAAETITETGSWPGYPRHVLSRVFADGTIAYLAGPDGLQVLDLHTPSHPQGRSFLPCLEVNASPSDIYVQSNRLCLGVLDGSFAGTNRVMGIDISDVDDPQSVWLGDLYPNTRPNQVCLDGEDVYSSHNTAGLTVSQWGSPGYGTKHASITNAWGRVVVAGDRIYVPTVLGFQIFSRSPKTSGGVVSTFDAGAEVKALAVEGNYVYLAAADGLHVVDVENEASPAPLGFLPLPSGRLDPTALELHSGHAWLIFSKTNVLMVANVAAPGSPEWVASYSFTGPVSDLSVSDGLALALAADDLYALPDLHVLNLSDPAHPAFEARLHATGRSRELALQNGSLFVADGDNGLCVLNVETPSTPQIICHQFAAAKCIAVANNLVHLGGAGGFSVFDIRDPVNPVLVTNSWQPVNHLEVVGDYSYRLGGFGFPELVITDVGDHFTEVGRKFLMNDVPAFSMVGNQFALLVNGMQGSLEIIDVQVAGLPTVTNYSSGARIVDVVGRADATGTNAFLATTRGLEILDLRDTNHIVRIGQWECPPEFEPNCICVNGDLIGLASTNHLWVIDRNGLGGDGPVIADAAINYVFSDMLLFENHLYAAAGADGVIVYQIGAAPSRPRLRISLQSSGQVNLEWNEAGPGWLLQQNEELGNPESWQIVPGSAAVTSTNIPPQAPPRFFRLIQQ